MGDERFSVRWKGTHLGDFDRTEIEEHLQSEQWSLQHEVKWKGRWIALEEFLRLYESGAEAKAEAESFVWDGWLLGGSVCGVILLFGLLLRITGFSGELGQGLTVGAVGGGLVGSACGLALLGQGRWVVGLGVVMVTVGLALAVMAWPG